MSGTQQGHGNTPTPGHAGPEKIKGKDFAGADMSQRDLSWVNLSHGSLKGVNFSRSILVHAHLDYADIAETDFSESNLTHADFKNTRLRRVTAKKAEMAAVQFNGGRVEGGDFSGAHLQGSNWEFVECKGTDFSRSNMAGANLLRGTFDQCDFSEARLVGADLSESRLKNTKMAGADLTAANLEGAELKGVDFRDARVSGARFWSAHGLSKEQKTFIVENGGSLYSPRMLKLIQCARFFKTNVYAQIGVLAFLLGLTVFGYRYSENPHHRNNRWVMDKAGKYLNRGDHDKALALYRLLLQRPGQENPLQIYSSMIQTYFQMNRFDKILEVYAEAVRSTDAPGALADIELELAN
ncbi:MAG TPA: pentapeptide repeat-containing protein, partial [Elusimicrobiota bacterium]|nr:pentapeptide repeat-containing protein [Elusimicrobiota bacterium]